MSKMKIIFVVLLVNLVVCATTAASDDLKDFDFESEDYGNYDESTAQNLRKSDDNFYAVDDTSYAAAQSNSFKLKEKRIRNSLVQATKDSAYVKKFTQIMPIIRSLSKQQRLVMAALITAQASSARGLNLSQVEEMFGDRQKLILPIVFDIANLVRTASTRNNKVNIDEDELITNAQFLKRSFDDHIEITNSTVQSTESEIPDSNLKDDRLTVDDSDDSRRVVVTNAKPIEVDLQKKGRSIGPESVVYYDRPPIERQGYHERKLNMTNFNGNNRTKDQLAMESVAAPLQITLPRALQNTRNISFEEYEDLVLADLNDTMAINKNTNGSSQETLPSPEMLISRYRLKNPYRKITPYDNSLDLRACERFGTICLRVEDYPMQQIMGSIRRHKHAMSALLAEYTDKDELEKSHQYLQDLSYNNKRREDDELTPSGMCPSIIRYARPQKARSAAGEWKYIVNTGQHTQTLRLEKCGKPEESCTYLTDNFRSRCVQIYNYHRLLSWDNTRGLHIDIFKVPTCCSCHIDGYREKFPPISSYNGGHSSDIDDYRFSASNIHPHNSHNSHYSTIVNDDEEDEEDSIAYQYSNGFKRSPHKFNKYGETSLLPSSSITKPRYDKTKPYKHPSYLPNPTLESYLTPPTSDGYEHSGAPYKRGVGSGKRPRRPLRNHDRDQSISGSEFLPDVTFIPTHDIITERASIRRKSTTPITATITGSTNGKAPPRPPSISTASTSSVDLGKRVNYNYHPIIDFFGDSVKSEKEIEDRVGGYSTAEALKQQQHQPQHQPQQQHNWQPIQQQQRHRPI